MWIVANLVAMVWDPTLTNVLALLVLVAFVSAVHAFWKKRFLAGIGRLLLFVLLVTVGAATIPVDPRSSRPRPSGENQAIGDCRAVGSAQVAYASVNGGVFGRLSCLATPENCGFPAGTARFIDPTIAALGLKGGYARSFVAGPPAKGNPDTKGLTSFVYAATPVSVHDGNRGIAIDASGRLCVTFDGTVPPIVNGWLSPTCNELTPTGRLLRGDDRPGPKP